MFYTGPRSLTGGRLVKSCIIAPVTQLYYAAACQTAFDCPKDRNEIAERTKRMCDIAEYTITGYEPFFDVRLLAFPEFAHAAPIYDSVAKLRDRLGVELPNEHTDRYAALAKSTAATSRRARSWRSIATGPTWCSIPLS